MEPCMRRLAKRRELTPHRGVRARPMRAERARECSRHKRQCPAEARGRPTPSTPRRSSATHASESKPVSARGGPQRPA
eukprot:3742412-Alexandrium_andersonii.AAC.1